jgi:hypothetical protein
MAGRTLAGALGLTGDWNLGENLWKDANDVNLLKLSVLVSGKVLSRVSATPGAPAEGDIHIFKADHPTEANKVAVYDEAGWDLFVPWAGLQLYSVADKASYLYTTLDGWTRVPNPFRIKAEETDSFTFDLDDADALVPGNSATAETATIPPDVFDVGTRLFLTQKGAGQFTWTPGAGVTINSRGAALKTAGQWAVSQAYQEALNVWTLTGDVTA